MKTSITSLITAGAALLLSSLAAPARADILYAINYNNSTIVKYTGSGVGSVFASTGLNEPFGLAFDSAGNLYAANGIGSTIEKFTPDGTGTLFANGALADGMAFDRAGNLYFANRADNTIGKITPGGVVSVFASGGLNQPRRLAFDNAGNLYVSNFSIQTIEKFSPTGTDLGVFANSEVARPVGLAFDRAGNLYAANSAQNTIMKITPLGVISIFASTGLDAPTGIAFDSAGNLYAANVRDGTIRKFSPTGTDLGVFASSGLSGTEDLAFTDDAGVPLPLANQGPTWAVTPSAGANGSISPDTVQAVNNWGSVSFTAKPAAGYRVSQWLVNGVPVQVGGATYTGLSNLVGSVSASTNVQVTFAPVMGAHFWQSSALTATPNAATGKRTGVAHASWPLYYYKGTDNNIWCVYYGGGSAWTQAPLTTAANVDDWLTFLTAYNLLCYRGTDGNLYGVYLSGSTWVTVTLSNVTANVAGDIAVDPLWNFIYYRGTDGGLWVVYFNGAAWIQVSLTAVSGFPAVVGGDLSVDASSHFVYFRGTDSHLYVAYYAGSAWQQAKLTTTANVGGALTADSGNLVYYRSSADNTPWASYFNGTAWAQGQLDAGTTMSTGTSVSSLYALHTCLYLDANGQCGVEYVNGSSWTHVKLGDGGSNLVGGLSIQHGTNWAFAQRSDGHVLMLYYR